MPRYLRYLRIAFSCTCGIAVVLLVVLWVRSYWYVDVLCIKISSSRIVAAQTLRGTLALDDLPSMPGTNWWWLGYGAVAPSLRFDSSSFLVPLWSLNIVSIVLATAPWLPWRFSLRTLLIATTLIALSLGLIIATTR